MIWTIFLSLDEDKKWNVIVKHLPINIRKYYYNERIEIISLCKVKKKF